MFPAVDLHIKFRQGVQISIPNQLINVFGCVRGSGISEHTGQFMTAEEAESFKIGNDFQFHLLDIIEFVQYTFVVATYSR